MGLAQAILELRFMGLTMPEDVKDLLIAGSGGVLSILFTLCYNACVLALARKSPELVDEWQAARRDEQG